jgi:hypothetical protein
MHSRSPKVSHPCVRYTNGCRLNFATMVILRLSYFIPITHEVRAIFISRVKTNIFLAERKFHESVNASLCENVQHIVLDPFSNLLPFKQSNIPVDYFSLQTAIDSACDDILVALASLPATEPLILSFSIKCTAEALHIIQLCSAKKAYIFRVRFSFPVGGPDIHP